MKEANEKLVHWPDVDENTFERFSQWAYTGDYDPEEPEVVDVHSPVEGLTPIPEEPEVIDLPHVQETAPSPIPDDTEVVARPPAEQPFPGYQDKVHIDNNEAPEQLPYSLLSHARTEASQSQGHCQNKECEFYGSGEGSDHRRVNCPRCKARYETMLCSKCGSVFSDCPDCQGTGPPTITGWFGCSNPGCSKYHGFHPMASTSWHKCTRCQVGYRALSCTACTSIGSDCPHCDTSKSGPMNSKRMDLIHDFLDESSTKYSDTTATNLQPLYDTDSRAHYIGVLLSHAKLYVMGDKYDISSLSQLTLHRLHFTLKSLTLYPGRLNEIATFARYVFENTVADDKLRDMVTLYYSCIVDASRFGASSSLIRDYPEFAERLILRLSKVLD